MAIYFGNLDRELDDRQRVLQEDAARQYRGVRDMRQSFGSLGDAVSSSIKDVAQAKFDQSKLEYDVRRNEKADEIRAEQHAQSTTRNRELSLDSKLKNIERFRKSSIENYLGRLWYWRDPKAIRATYDARMKVFTADNENLTAEQRIENYPHLFGQDALKKLKLYKAAVKMKADGFDVKDEDIQKKRDALPLTPMGFMDWAKDGKYYNTNMKEINPTKIPNAMQRAALIDYGYNIPDADKDYNGFSKEASVEDAGLEEDTTKVEEKGDAFSESSLTSNPKEAREKVKALGIDPGEGDFLGGELKDGVWVAPDGTSYKLGSDETTTKLSAEEAAATEVGDITQVDEEVKLAEQKLSQETQDAVEQVTTVDEDALRYQKYHRQMMKSPGYPGRANPFKVANEIANTIPSSTQKVANQLIKEGKPVTPPSAMVYNLQGPERERDPAFFPFYEAKRGQEIGAEYSKLPNYYTWENVSDEEKNAILTHPETELYGASPKSVASLIKARENLEDIDEQIGFLKDEVTKHDKNISTWKESAQSWQAILPDGNPPRKYGGMLDEHPEKRRARTNLAMQLPFLEDERKELVARFNAAQATVDASKPGKSKSIYRGSVASEFGVSNNQGPATMTPEQGVGTVDIDAGDQAAIDANYAIDTEEEIINGIIDREGFGPANAGYAYFDGPKPGPRGYYIKDDAEILTLAGGNNIWGTINGMPAEERKQAIEEVATAMFGNRGVRRKEFIRFLNMPKKDHKKEYDTIVKRGRLRLTEGQRNYLTKYSYRNHLERMVKHHPYLSGIGQYPKEMQVFLMDNAFNMGPRWLKDKFTKTEKYLRRWVKTRLPSDLEKMKEEYKNSDHYRNTTRAKDLIAML